MLIEITYNVTDVYMSTTETPVYVEISFEQPGGTSAVWGSITGTLSNQTDLQNALNAKFDDPTGTTAQYLRGDGSLATFPTLTGYVPYTGATTNVDLGEYELKAGQLTLDVSPTGTAAVGTTRWNDTTGVSETTLKGGNVLLRNGVDLVARVVNKVTPNTTLTKAAYQAVRVSGAQGQRLAVAFAQANNDANSADTIGLVIETIPTNQEGFIMAVGQLENINTTGSLQGETWADGDVLYLSPTIAGAITNVKPTGNGHLVIIGYVEYAHANNGKIYCKITNGYELTELHDVDIVSPANNEALIYESSSALWKNKSIPTALGYTPANAATTLTINGVTYDLSTSRTWTIAAGISGSGTTNELAYFTASTTLASLSVITYPSLTEISYVKGVTSALQTQLNAKQGTLTLTTTGTSGAATLIGNTLNIPQYSGGGGGMAIGGSITSATAGSVLFVGTSGVLAQNNSGFFWNNTNQFLQITSSGTTTRGLALSGASITAKTYFGTFADVGYIYSNAQYTNSWQLDNNTLPSVGLEFGAGTGAAKIRYAAAASTSFTDIASFQSTLIRLTPSTGAIVLGSTSLNSGHTLQVYGDTLLRGSGATSATTALTVQNSSSTNLLTVRNDGRVGINTNAPATTFDIRGASAGIFLIRDSPEEGFIRIQTGDPTNNNGIAFRGLSNQKGFRFCDPVTSANNYMQLWASGNLTIETNTTASYSDVASALLQVNSTTKGFLPPRMTTTQKNAIATPAAGLVVYDTTLAKLCVYTTAWETITSI